MDGPTYEGHPQKTTLMPFEGYANSRRRSTWAGTVVLACLALGFMASAVDYERIRVKAEEHRAEFLATADSSVEGQLEDLGKFMAEPATRLVRLAPPGSAIATDAVIAWNSDDQRGYLLCDSLQTLRTPEQYEVWALRGADDPIQLAGIQAHPGMSVYPFHADGAMKSKDRLEITAGPRSAENKPILTGEIE